MITGSLSTSKGSVRVGGFDVMDDHLKAKKLMGYLPEVVPLYPEMTATEFLKFAGRLRGLYGKTLSLRMTYVLEACGIKSVQKRLIRSLSKGFRQRIGIATALIHDPRILILDEPTIGLDPVQIIEIRKLIKSLADEHTVILSTHILPEVASTCSRVIIIHRGSIVAEDTVENLADGLRNTNNIKIRIKTPPLKKDLFISELRKIQGVIDIHSKSENEFTIKTPGEIDIRDRIAFAVTTGGQGLLELTLEKITLEDVFVKLTTTEEGV